jgi:hypothetical protein
VYLNLLDVSLGGPFSNSLVKGFYSLELGQQGYTGNIICYVNVAFLSHSCFFCCLGLLKWQHHVSSQLFSMIKIAPFCVSFYFKILMKLGLVIQFSHLPITSRLSLVTWIDELAFISCSPMYLKGPDVLVLLRVQLDQ